MRPLPLVPATALLGAALLGLAGCAGSSGGSADPALATSSALVSTLPAAEVKGHLLRVGGPPPGDPVPLRGRVTITGTDGSVTTVEVDAHGDFDIKLSPGTYRLRATSPEINDGRQLCRTQFPTTALRAGATVIADIICSVK